MDDRDLVVTRAKVVEGAEMLPAPTGKIVANNYDPRGFLPWIEGLYSPSDNGQMFLLDLDPLGPFERLPRTLSHDFPLMTGN